MDTLMDRASATESHPLGADAHAVYRCFAADGTLLYIGVTGDLGRRLSAHAKTRWFVEVATIRLEWHPDQAAAEAAERSAIFAEQPKRNIVHKNGPARSRGFRESPAGRELRRQMRLIQQAARHTATARPRMTTASRKERFAQALESAPLRGTRPRDLQAACGLGRTLTHHMLAVLVEQRAVVRVAYGRYRAAPGGRDLTETVLAIEPPRIGRETEER